MQSNRIFTILLAFSATLAGFMGVAYATDYTWKGSSDGQWDNDASQEDNWFGGFLNDFPVDGDTGLQDDAELARIQVDSDERCDAFTGDGDSPNDRFILLDAQQTLTVDGNLSKVTGTQDYLIRVKDGASGNETEVLVGGNITGIDIVAARNNNGDWARINATGDVADSDFDLRDNVSMDVDGDMGTTTLSVRDGSNIDVAGDVTGNASPYTGWDIGNSGTVKVHGDFYDTNLSVGARGLASGGAQVTVGSMGDPTATHSTMSLTKDAELIVSNAAGFGGGHYVARYDTIASLVEMRDDSRMIVHGRTEQAFWDMYNDSYFEGQGDIHGGEWILADDSRVVALLDIGLDIGNFCTNCAGTDSGGIWRVRSDGGTSSWGVDVDSDQAFNPSLLELDGGTVRTGYLGYNSALSHSSDDHPEWDMEFKGDSLVAISREGWHEGAGSEISYDGTNNTYQHSGALNGIWIEGPIKQVDSLAELTIQINSPSTTGGYVTAETALTSINGSGVWSSLAFEVEGVQLKIQNGANIGGHMEAIGPDYELSDDDPLFTDSPCVKRWGELRILDAGASDSTTITDQHPNYGVEVGQGKTWQSQESVYAIDIFVEKDAILYVATPLIHAAGTVFNIYYTGTVDLNCTGSDCGEILNLDNTDYTPIKLVARLFGDFDGATAGNDGDTTSNRDRFEDAWCTCERKTTPDAAYDALTDWDCDGDVDDVDRTQYLANWTGATELNSLSSCPHSTVCD